MVEGYGDFAGLPWLKLGGTATFEGGLACLKLGCEIFVPQAPGCETFGLSGAGV